MAEDAEDVVVSGLAKSYASRPVLRGLDLRAEAGQITAVLGPSGCGKTTLLRIVAGFVDADDGSVEVGGREVTRVPAHRRRIGLLPQEGALFPYLSVGANIAFGLPRERRSEEVARWLELVGLADYHDARPHELSGGQQQRVALARALAPQPRVVLLDEPFSALDAGLRTQVRDDIAAILAACATTAILVTHDQAEALSLAQSVALLADGAVSQHGSPEELYTRPTTLAAARFVGATVEVAGSRSGATVSCALGRLPTEGSAANGPVLAILRPEQLRLTTGHGVDAVIRRTRYHGSHTELRVALADGTEIDVQVRGPDSSRPGTAVRIAVDGKALAYPHPGPPPNEDRLGSR